MKKAILLLSVVFIFLLGASEASAQKIKIGVRAGYNSASWRGESANAVNDLMDNSSVFSIREKPGFYAGIYTNIPLADRVVLEPGLYYSQKGLNISVAYPGENMFNVRGSIINHAHYIDLPLQLKVYLNDMLYLYGGPQISYLVSNEVEGRAGIMGLSRGYKFDYDGAFRKLDFGLSGGVGIDLYKRFNLQVGYEYGLSKVDDAINANIYNRVIKAGLGINF